MFTLLPCWSSTNSKPGDPKGGRSCSCAASHANLKLYYVAEVCISFRIIDQTGPRGGWQQSIGRRTLGAGIGYHRWNYAGLLDLQTKENRPTLVPGRLTAPCCAAISRRSIDVRTCAAARQPQAGAAGPAWVISEPQNS